MVYVRIMRNLLQDDEAIQALQFLNRATMLIHEATNKEYIVYFKLCQARILDATRKFLEAATKYRIFPLTSLIQTTYHLKSSLKNLSDYIVSPRQSHVPSLLPQDHNVPESWQHCIRTIVPKTISPPITPSSKKCISSAFYHPLKSQSLHPVSNHIN